jgi:hypothetical protein
METIQTQGVYRPDGLKDTEVNAARVTISYDTRSEQRGVAHSNHDTACGNDAQNTPSPPCSHGGLGVAVKKSLAKRQILVYAAAFTHSKIKCVYQPTR